MSVLHVAFRVGAAEYVVPGDQVLHLDAFESATPIPGAQPYVTGLVQVRGRLVPVVDLRMRFGMAAADDGPSDVERRADADRRADPAPLTDAERRERDRRGTAIGRRVIVVQSGTRVAGLLVDSAREVLRIDPSAFSPPPELVDAGGFVKAVAMLGTRLVLLIDVPRILGEELTHA